MFAPICLFVYKRPEHTRQTLNGLKSNPEAASSDLWVFCDAARSPKDEAQVLEVRRLCEKIEGFKSVRLIQRTENWGLAKNIIEGVSDVLKTSETVIVVEDDLVVSPYFLRYMNDGLTVFANDEKVGCIHGYLYPIKPIGRNFFLRGADCWGWATWRRAWQYFEPDGTKLLNELERGNWLKEFDFNGAATYVKMLQDQIAGRNQSWAVRWHASLFLKNMLTLYPAFSLVQNIGMDASGEHCDTSERFDITLAATAVPVIRIPLVEDREGWNRFRQFFWSLEPWWIRRIPPSILKPALAIRRKILNRINS